MKSLSMSKLLSMLRNWICMMYAILPVHSLFAQTVSTDIQFRIHLQPDSIIYVNDDNTSGAWSGTAAFPFQNIPEGLAIADLGVTVYVLQGNYPVASDILVEQGVTLFLDTCVQIRFNKTQQTESGYCKTRSAPGQEADGGNRALTDKTLLQLCQAETVSFEKITVKNHVAIFTSKDMKG
jgi:hypothetical protein